MRNDLFDKVCIVVDREVKTPVSVHASLPQISALVELLCPERGMIEILFQESGLLVEGSPNSRRSGLQR